MKNILKMFLVTLTFARPDYKRPSVDTNITQVCCDLEQVNQYMSASILEELDDYYFVWCRKRGVSPKDYDSFTDFTYNESYMEMPAISYTLYRVTEGDDTRPFQLESCWECVDLQGVFERAVELYQESNTETDTEYD